MKQNNSVHNCSTDSDLKHLYIICRRSARNEEKQTILVVQLSFIKAGVASEPNETLDPKLLLMLRHQCMNVLAPTCKAASASKREVVYKATSQSTLSAIEVEETCSTGGQRIQSMYYSSVSGILRLHWTMSMKISQINVKTAS